MTSNQVRGKYTTEFKLEAFITPHGEFLGLEKMHACKDEKLLPRSEAMDTLLNWMAFYNNSRLHSSLGYLSPMQYEQRWYQAQRKKAA